jgi:hypothetical protein
MAKECLKLEELLAEGGVYIGPTVGVSMLPMLKNRRDTVVVCATKERLKRLDVALYKRGDDYVLHRVIMPFEDGYLIRGDNTYVDEFIPEKDILGVLTEFFRKDKHYFCTDKKYLKYAEKRVKSYKVRRFFARIKLKIKGACSKIVRALRIKK